MHALLHRRQLLRLAAGAMAGSCLPTLCSHAAYAADQTAAIGLGFSLYGMKSLPLADAIALCAKVGYDGVEWSALADWPGEAARLHPAPRHEEDPGDARNACQ